MPNQRSAGQKLINVPMDEEFIRRMDQAVALSGLANRSAFIREAIQNKLAEMGVELPVHAASAPLRLGKGGRKPKPTALTSALPSEAPVQLDQRTAAVDRALMVQDLRAIGAKPQANAIAADKQPRARRAGKVKG